MRRPLRLVLIAITLFGIATTAWAGCGPACFAPPAQLTPVCPPQVIYREPCCEPIPVMPPTPPLVSPVLPPAPVPFPVLMAPCQTIAPPPCKPVAITKVRPSAAPAPALKARPMMESSPVGERGNPVRASGR